ncbi:MAG: hypothetical protein Q8835_03690 [Sweet potato little leaf phytoplasma]|nr:hypothetical protein [Sweet potato little leaf phytoplasma]
MILKKKKSNIITMASFYLLDDFYNQLFSVNNLFHPLQVSLNHS